MKEVGSRQRANYDGTTGWTGRRVSMLRSWEMQAKTLRRLNLRASSIYYRRWVVLGTFATILGVIGGPGSILSDFSEESSNADGDPFNSWTFSFKAVSTISAAATALLLWLQLESKAKTFEDIAHEWGRLAGSIRRECSRELHDESFRSFQKRISEDFSELEARPTRLPENVQKLSRAIRQEIFEEEHCMDGIDVQMYQWEQKLARIYSKNEYVDQSTSSKITAAPHSNQRRLRIHSEFLNRHTTPKKRVRCITNDIKNPTTLDPW